MVFDGSQGNAFLRNARNKAAQSNALPVGQRKNSVPNIDKSDEPEKAENEHKQFLDELLTISKGVIIAISNPDLKKIYLRIAEYAFRAYTRAENNKQVNGVKALASDKTNIAFRTQIQSGCIGVKDELAEEKKTSDFDHIRQELGMKPGDLPFSQTRH